MGNEVQSLLIGTISAGAIVVFGGLYAAGFALANLRSKTGWRWSAWAAYAGLFFSTLMLVNALSLQGWWLGLIVCLLLGYLVAPHLIWRLSVATHESEGES